MVFITSTQAQNSCITLSMRPLVCSACCGDLNKKRQMGNRRRIRVRQYLYAHPRCQQMGGDSPAELYLRTYSNHFRSWYRSIVCLALLPHSCRMYPTQSSRAPGETKKSQTSIWRCFTGFGGRFACLLCGLGLGLGGLPGFSVMIVQPAWLQHTVIAHSYSCGRNTAAAPASCHDTQS